MTTVAYTVVSRPKDSIPSSKEHRSMAGYLRVEEGTACVSPGSTVWTGDENTSDYRVTWKAISATLDREIGTVGPQTRSQAPTGQRLTTDRQPYFLLCPSARMMNAGLHLATLTHTIRRPHTGVPGNVRVLSLTVTMCGRSPAYSAAGETLSSSCGSLTRLRSVEMLPWVL
ncbi:hypothetical protein R6Z07F_018000 [Ovis aries]